MTTETYRYRGYDIVPIWQWSSWCTGVYSTRADLPILPLLDAEHAGITQGRCGDRSQEEYRPISLTPKVIGWERVGLNALCFQRIGELFPIVLRQPVPLILLAGV